MPPIRISNKIACTFNVLNGWPCQVTVHVFLMLSYRNYTTSAPSCGCKGAIFFEGALYLWRKGGKAQKKWRKTGKGGKILRKTGKEKCGGNRKMTFLGHGKPENLKISAENGKLSFKTAETGKWCWKAAENRKTPKRQWKVAESRKARKKATESRKNIKFSAESRKLTPYNPPSCLLGITCYYRPRSRAIMRLVVSVLLFVSPSICSSAHLSIHVK